MDNKLKTVVVTLRLGVNDYKTIKGMARNEVRSFNSQVSFILGNYIKSIGLQSDVFDDIEDEKPVRVDYNVNTDDIFQMFRIFKEKITLTLDSGLIKVHSNGIDTAKLLSMLVNAISITILNASNGNINKKDELVNQIVGLLKGE